MLRGLLIVATPYLIDAKRDICTRTGHFLFLTLAHTHTYLQYEECC